MKIAIIGAGLAGLSCAHELERYGITPVIYERNSFIGEAYSHVGAVLEVVYRPIKDIVRYMKNEFAIDIKPINTVNSVIHHAPNKTTVIEGNLGYFFDRSKASTDLKIQLHSQLKKTQIFFNEFGDYELLSKQFDYVVVANGDISFTKELGCWREWVNTYVMGAEVFGDFDPTSMTVWINKNYCKNGYAYLTPFSSKKASLNLVVTDVNEKEIEEYWQSFLYAENIKHTIIETYKVNHISGFVYPHRVGKVFLAGNAGGVIDPFLGFGVAGAITSGVMAARSILTGKDYEKLLQSIVKRNLRLYEFRKALNSSGNIGYDLIITSIGLPGIKKVIYATPLNVVKAGGAILRFNRKLKSKLKD